MQAIIKRLSRFNRDKRGITTVITVMLSLVLIVIIVGNVFLGSYQMNQVDMDKMQENLSLTNVTHVRSPWFTAQTEYTVNAGTWLSGNFTDTQAEDSSFETFSEATPLTNATFNPSEYILNGSAQLISGAVSDLISDDSLYMIFRSYPSAFAPQALFSHSETTTIAGSTYYQLRTSSADSSGVVNFQADAESTGRKLLSKFVYPLAGVAAIPGSTWTVSYRAYTDHPEVSAYCNVDMLIRKADGTVRMTIATHVANSTALTTSPTTVSGTYPWSSFGVADGTDYLEIDFYAVVTSGKNGKSVYLTVDNPSLPVSDQTRISGVTLPSVYTVQLELTGTGSIQSKQNIMWTLNSAFTAASVSTTLQLYSYNASQYPSSGDGYIAYTSSSTASSDETKSQTIASNSTFYLNSTGGWKVRITGVKSTASPFDLKLDLVEFKAASSDTSTLNITNSFSVNLQSYPADSIRGLEILLRYDVLNTGEKWFMQTYDWTALGFSDAGFNSTSGSQPIASGWNEYAVNVADWNDYIAENGTVLIQFSDAGASINQTTVMIDFLGVRVIIDEASLEIKNSSPSSIHIVAIWITDSASHQRYDADLFLNSGESAAYTRADVTLPQDSFVAKVVTERGNIAVFSSG